MAKRPSTGLSYESGRTMGANDWQLRQSPSSNSMDIEDGESHHAKNEPHHRCRGIPPLRMSSSSCSTANGDRVRQRTASAGDDEDTVWQSLHELKTALNHLPIHNLGTNVELSTIGSSLSSVCGALVYGVISLCNW